MKVFSLRCEHKHVFEGWFASGEAYDSQLASGMLECPVCGSGDVQRIPSAPRLNLASGVAGVGDELSQADVTQAMDMQKMWLKMARYIRDNTEYVGERFAEEARKMHYSEVPERAIRGHASHEQSKELADEGIEVFSFPMPREPSGPLQ